jgi:ATP-binding cassette, subfamily C (CFTR/MRP), member 4
MSNDVSKFDWLMSFTHDFWRPPLAAIGAGYFIYQQVGYAGLLGMAILILFMPLQGEN